MEKRKNARSEQKGGNEMKNDLKVETKKDERNAKTSKKPEEKIHFEFGGPFGALSTMISLPFIVFGLYFSCTKEACLNFDTVTSQDKLNEFGVQVYAAFSNDFFGYLFSWKAATMTACWVIMQVMMERLLPGEKVLGVPINGIVAQKKGDKVTYTSTTDLETYKDVKLPYVMSGHLQFWLTLVLLFYGGMPEFTSVTASTSIPLLKSLVPMVSLSDIYDNYPQLIMCSLLFSTALSVYLYASSFGQGKVLAKGGASGYIPYDFFMGRELNPRLFNNTLDLKEFCELRPGLIGWLVINLGMAAAQYRANDYRGISGSMCLIVLYQGLYVWDAVYNEKSILTTMDITTDGFGFMLSFGDLTWVPFIYTLQARYLVDHDPNLSVTALMFISFIHFLGYYIFRSANSEKDAFRTNPDSPQCRHLKYIVTSKGRKLLTSGWWGSARKINYTGDWLVTFSWCLLCGFQSPIPYFQAIYFCILLIHRAFRDDAGCAEKYGEDWNRYKKAVPYMFIPGVV